MPSSGGSVSDAPVNKVVDGKSHYLAYITPDEGKSLQQQGGKEVITDTGIPAYPPPGERGGPGSGSEGRSPSGEGRGEYQSPPSTKAPDFVTHTPTTTTTTTTSTGDDTTTSTGDDHDEDAATLPGHVEYGPVQNIEDIHGEHDDPDSVSSDPTYDPTAQAVATKAAAFGTGEKAGDYQWNPTTQTYDRRTDYTFKEHWDKAPDALKFSPSLRLLYATGANLTEGFSGFSGINGSGDDPDSGRGNDGGSTAPPVSNAQSNFITSGQIQPTNSVAANWYQNLGSSSASEQQVDLT